MGVSERLVYHLIEQLKDYDARICYDRGRRTYYYCDDFQLQLNVSLAVGSSTQMTQVFGGHYLAS